MVLLQPKRPKVPERGSPQSCRGIRVLEGDWNGQGDIQRIEVCRSEESFGFLQREAAKRREDGLDHA